MPCVEGAREERERQREGTRGERERSQLREPRRKVCRSRGRQRLEGRPIFYVEGHSTQSGRRRHTKIGQKGPQGRERGENVEQLLVARKEGFGKGSIAKRGKLSTVDLLELTNLDRLLLTWQA